VGARLAFALWLAVGVALTPSVAGALTYSVRKGHDPAVLADGEIKPGDAKRLEAYLKRTPGVGTVQLSSPGGSLVEGIDIGTLIRRRGLATRVGAGDMCASACVYAFVGGVIREVERDGKIGVHMATVEGWDAYIRAIKAELLNTNKSLDERIRTIVRANELYGAIVANASTMHLLKMGVSVRLFEVQASTSARQIHWLTTRELHDFNVTNAE
jgi:hypothetical protein